VSIDLETMDPLALKELQAKVGEALEKSQARRREEALRAVHETAAAHGFALEELVGKGRDNRSVGYVSRPRYANPADASETWTGRGRRPAWVKSYIQDGGALEDLKIPSA
jgi:DNA-binding protein H-NS